MARKAKKGTPEEVDKLINMRETIGEEEYTRYWRRLNRARRENRFEQEAEKIKNELSATSGRTTVEPSTPAPKFFSTRAGAERVQRRSGGRIVRRNAKGQFSKRGRKFQVINVRR